MILARDYFVYVPLAANLLLALLFTWFGHDALRGQNWACSGLAVLTSFVGFSGIVGYIAHAIGPAKSFLSMLAQTAISIYIYSVIYYRHGYSVDEHGNTVSIDFWDSMYISVVTWTGLGDPGALPMESVRLATAMQSITGYVFLALLLGIVGTAVTNPRDYDPPIFN